jgi:hypothetical protein
MGVYTGIIQTFKNRIDTAMEVGFLLEDVIDFQIGNKLQNDGINTFPKLILNAGGSFITETFEACAVNKKEADMELVLTVLCRTTGTGSDNFYFDSEGGGILPLIERVLDVVSSKTDGSLDPRLLQYGRKSSVISVGNIDTYRDDIVYCDINFTLNIKDFVINNRREA